MIVFGIDPGCTVTGFGVVESRRGRVRYLDSGHVKTKPSMAMALRLQLIHDFLRQALGRHELDAVAIEAIFRHKSSESALRLGQARGVALLAAASYGFDPHEYNAMTVKKTVGAHGRADKNAMRKMVGMLLGRPIEGPADEADALGIAITHCAHGRATPVIR